MGQSNPKEIPHDLSLYENLKCLICDKLSVKAVETSCCHNIYCESCLTTFKSTNDYCPSCKSGAFEVLPSFLGRKMISAIPSSCPLKSSSKISLDDFENHQKTCINKPSYVHSQADDTVLDDAVKAKRVEKTSSRAGTIEGFYIQLRTQYPINGTFTIKDQVVMITTYDTVGSADWGGKIDLKNLDIQLIKSYRGAHKVYYRGKFNPLRIEYMTSSKFQFLDRKTNDE